MNRVRSWVNGALLVSFTVGSSQQLSSQQNGGAPLSSTTDTGSLSLEERVNELDQQIRVLQRLRELAAESTAMAANTATQPNAGKDGFNLKSADGKYSLRFRGYIHSDGRFFPSSDAVPATDNLLIRRARPIVEATVGRYFDFRLMPDFGGSSPTIVDAYWDGRFAPEFIVRAGKFKPPVGLERLQSATDIVFAERGLPTNLVPSRDIGLQVAGDVSAGVLAYQIGVFNGTVDLGGGGDDLSDAKDFVARVFVQPFKAGTLRGLGVGLAGSAGIERGSTATPALPSYRSGGQQTFFRYRADGALPANTVYADGKRSRLSPQGYFHTGPLGLLGEYVMNRNEVTRAGVTAELEHTAWQAVGSFFLTGESAGFKSPAPRRPFDLQEGGLGAVELVARYGELTADEASFPVYASLASSARRARAWGVGVNWHFTRAIKVALNYERTSFDGGSAAGDRESENAVIARFQTSF